MIEYTDNLNGKQNKIELNVLENQLLNKFKPSRKNYGGKGLTIYEYINLKDNTIKMYFDFDKKITLEEYEHFDIDEYEETLIEFIGALFHIDSDDITVGCDNRPKEDHYKLSYHIILNKKIENNTLLKLIPKLKKCFKKVDYELDTSVYGNGFQKFRTCFSKKHNKDGSIEKNSLMRPLTDKKSLSRHLIQYIKDVSVIDLEILNENINELLGDEIKCVEYENQENIDDIIQTYKVVNEKTYNDCIIYNVDTVCPFINRKHKSNHCYLIKFSNCLLIKCHDEECKNKAKVLYKKINTDTVEFDINVFNSFDIETDNNYETKREYFEKYYKYFKDTNTLYRIKHIYNNQYDYYEKDLCAVDRGGLNDLYYQQKNDKGIIEHHSFIKKYIQDPNKTFLFNVIFKPHNNKNNDKYYNLFEGFNYEEILNKTDEITENDKNDFDFFIEYIKTYICENNIAWFNYFIGFFALIIQNPCFLIHIIFLFYSSKQRTGKSNFLKFISRVFGMRYCYFGSFKQIIDNPHTTAHLGTFLNIIEEINFSNSNKCEDQIKDYSQREVGIYNPKGKTEIKVNTYVRYIGTSNNSNALRIGDEDQRIVVWEFQKINDKKYVERLEAIYQNKKMIYLFGDYLRNFPLPYNKRNNWILNRPITSAYKLMIHNDSIKSFMKDLYLCDNMFEDEEFVLLQLHSSLTKNNKDILKISTTKMYNYYTNYCSKCGVKAFAETNFKKALLSRYSSIIFKRSNGSKYIINLKTLKQDLKIEEEYQNYIISKTNNNENDTETE